MWVRVCVGGWVGLGGWVHAWASVIQPMEEWGQGTRNHGVVQVRPEDGFVVGCDMAYQQC